MSGCSVPTVKTPEMLFIPEVSLRYHEAAALETVATMGWERFTIRMLREALGFSYHQTYRILHGYASRGTAYSGLLEKCPCSLPGLEQRCHGLAGRRPGQSERGFSCFHIFTRFSPEIREKCNRRSRP